LLELLSTETGWLGPERQIMRPTEYVVIYTMRFSTNVSKLVLSLACLSAVSALPSPAVNGGQNTVNTEQE